MESVGAYGGGKAGGTFDPIAFAQRPQVIVRAVCWVSSEKINFVLILCKRVVLLRIQVIDERSPLLEWGTIY